MRSACAQRSNELGTGRILFAEESKSVFVRITDLHEVGEEAAQLPVGVDLVLGDVGGGEERFEHRHLLHLCNSVGGVNICLP